MSDQYQGEPVKPSEVEQTNIRADAPAFTPLTKPTTTMSFSAKDVDSIEAFIPGQYATQVVSVIQPATTSYRPAKSLPKLNQQERTKLKHDSAVFVPFTPEPVPVSLGNEYPSLGQVPKIIEAKAWVESGDLNRVKAPPPAPKQKTPKMILANKPTIKITEKTEDEEALVKEAEAAPIETALAGDESPIDLQLTQEIPETKEEESREDEVQELRPSSAPIQAEIKEQARVEEATLEEAGQTEAEVEETELTEPGTSQAESPQAQTLEPVKEATLRGLDEETKEIRLRRPFTYDTNMILAIKQVSPR
jgi:hypothetical protein